jgi:hypothetical protein
MIRDSTERDFCPRKSKLKAVMASLMLPFVFLAYGIRTSVTSFFTHLFKRALFANKLLFAGLEVHRVAIAKISLPQR